jgi:peptidoglycan/xylan/chitin deacetylase (PgdA/CDA1 family)
MGAMLRTLAGWTFWAMPWRFSVAAALGRRYGLRCVVFHEIADAESPFTRGLGVTVAPARFEAYVRFLARHYVPVTLDRVLQGGELPERAVLVTFDDAYASVARVAAPLLSKHGVPAAFFVNAGFVGNEDLGFDNVLSYVHETKGLALLKDAAASIGGGADAAVWLDDLILKYTSRLKPAEVAAYRAEVVRRAGISTQALAREARLYMDEADLRSLAAHGVAVGSHTFSHPWCRSLDAAAMEREIAGNVRRLAELGAPAAPAFAVPYGSPTDATPALRAELARGGCRAVFVVRGLPNAPVADLANVDRVSVHSQSDPDAFLELEVLPRLRVVRSRMRSRKGQCW